MQLEMITFEYEAPDRQFRTVQKDGQTWFVLNDVCRELEIANSRDAASRLDADEKDDVGISDAIGRVQKTTIINESGFYALVMRSNKPEAKRLRKWVTSEVLPSIRKTGSFGASIPAFVKRAVANFNNVDAGHFSVINELLTRLHGRLHAAGHTMADTGPDGKEIRPDVSVGRGFSVWLKKHHPDVKDNYTYYPHSTEQATFAARQYPVEMWPLYAEYLDLEWIPSHAADYFRDRDPQALMHLPNLLPSPDKPAAGMMRKPTLQITKK